MLERKITNILSNQKKQDNKLCLLVRGARQVGKTFIVDDFAKKNYNVNEGSIVENVCAEEIITRYESATYFEKKSKLEIDFIMNIDGVCTALEIKSGNNKQAKSLKSIIENYKTVKRFIKLENNTNIYVDENGVEHYPLFMIMFL